MADGSAKPAKRPPSRTDDASRADVPFAVLIALALHLALVPLVWSLPAARLVAPEPEQAVNVEIVAPPVSARSPEREPSPTQAAGPRPPASPQPAPTTAPVQATRMLSGQLLAQPKSRRALAALNKTAPTDRIIQICNIEAMAQIHAWKPNLDPDFVVAYALAPIRLGSDALEARGAAVRDARHWFALTYRCGLASDHRSVERFQFLLGETIPQAQWSELNLPADEGGID